MDNCRLQARDWLSRSTRKEFEAIIQEAKLTPRQMEIIELKFIHDLKNYQIAMRIDTKRYVSANGRKRFAAGV